MIVGLVSFRAFSQEPAIMKTVRSVYNGNTSLQTSFTVHIIWKVREKEETKNGKFFLAPGDKFRAEMGEAAFISDGETYWQVTRDDKGEQVVIKRLSDVDLAALPSRVLSTYLDKYIYRLKEEHGGETIVQWKADSASSSGDVVEIRMSIARKSGAVTKLFVVDKSGNESAYTFNKIKIGVKLSPSLFTYALTKGASVIDMRK